MSVDPQIKFSRAFKGYEPREVDAVFDEMQREINELKHTISQYDGKIRQLADSTALLEQEWAKKSPRIVVFLDALLDEVNKGLGGEISI